jgi:hypothetical protein
MAHVWGKFEACGIGILWEQICWELGDGYDEHRVTRIYVTDSESPEYDNTETYSVTGYRAFSRAQDKFGEMVMEEIK